MLRYCNSELIMVLNGKGGSIANLNGRVFENSTSFKDILNKVKNLSVEENGDIVLTDTGEIIGKLISQGKTFKYLKDMGLKPESKTSKRYNPDEALVVYKSKKVFIIEKKFQNVSGSVDSKVLSAPFFLKTYRRLFRGSGLKVEFHYLLSDWFNKPSYKDYLDFIKDSGCKYHFNKAPMDLFLPLKVNQKTKKVEYI